MNSSADLEILCFSFHQITEKLFENSDTNSDKIQDNTVNDD